MKKPSKVRRVGVIIAIIAAFTLILLPEIASFHQGQLNEGLVIAINARDPARVADLLGRGADARAKFTLSDKPEQVQGVSLFLANAEQPSSFERLRAFYTGRAALPSKGKECILLLWGGDNPALNFRHDDASPANIAMLKLLLEHGANANAKDQFGQTALMYATWTVNTSAADLLLEHGADPNLTFSAGHTVLMNAVIDRNTELIRLLLAHGANASARADNGETVAAAVRRGRHHAEIVKLLSAQAGSNARSLLDVH